MPERRARGRSETEVKAAPNTSPDPKGRAASPHWTGHRQRLREKLLESGGTALADYEILELMLFAAIPRADTKPLAKALLAKFGSFGAVLAADVRQLEGVTGCGPAVIAAIKLAREAGLRMLKADVIGRTAISSWQALLDYCSARLAHEATERFHILFLDRKNQVIAEEEQQRGTVDHTPVYPREVVRRALELQASALILVHNHPSGDPAPSKADIDMTRTVREAARAVGIELHDHLVIGRGQYLSFRAQGLLG